jgi:hypothetical protein
MRLETYFATLIVVETVMDILCCPIFGDIVLLTQVSNLHYVLCFLQYHATDCTCSPPRDWMPRQRKKRAPPVGNHVNTINRMI